MLSIHSEIPELFLFDVIARKMRSTSDIKGTRGTLIMFLSTVCSTSNYAIDEIVRIANDYRVEGIGFAGIFSNDTSQLPADDYDQIIRFGFQHNIKFPLLSDHLQVTAKRFEVINTPDFFLFDNKNILYYHGQIDDSLPGNNIHSSGSDLRNAIDSLLYNRTLNPSQKHQKGTDIIWKKT